MTGSFDPERVLEVLHRHNVEFVLIGGLAAVAHGSPLPTTDVDVTPERSAANLERLAAALVELDARIRTADPEGVVVLIDGPFLAAQPHLLNLTTSAGDVDITFTPTGFDRGFEQLYAASDPMDLVEGIPTRVASLEAIVRSKEAADREKDRRALPYLWALLEERGDT